ncbi:hypothetical protein [Komarekiella delphini-convector]|nr:hypothetical protein [Komarekiella delphini-convector]
MLINYTVIQNFDSSEFKANVNLIQPLRQTAQPVSNSRVVFHDD